MKKNARYIVCGRSDKVWWHYLIIFSMVFALVLVLTIIVPGTLGSKKFLDLCSSNFGKIDSADAFIKALDNSSKTQEEKKDYNIVVPEIILTKEHLDKIAEIEHLPGEYGVWFYGNLNGNSKTIKIQYSEEESKPFEIDHPIFDQICEGATVNHLNIVCDTGVTFTSKDDNQASVIARVNNGEVSDVNLEASIKIKATTNAAGGICVFNYGTIEFCKIEINYVTSENYWSNGGKLNADTWNCYMGAIAAFNIKEDVNNIIIGSNYMIDKMDEERTTFAVLSLLQYNKSGHTNKTIGYAFGSYNSIAKDDINIIVVTDKLNVVDSDLIEYKTLADINKEPWEKRQWIYINGVLKQEQGMKENEN